MFASEFTTQQKVITLLHTKRKCPDVHRGGSSNIQRLGVRGYEYGSKADVKGVYVSRHDAQMGGGFGGGLPSPINFEVQMLLLTIQNSLCQCLRSVSENFSLIPSLILAEDDTRVDVHATLRQVFRCSMDFSHWDKSGGYLIQALCCCCCCCCCFVFTLHVKPSSLVPTPLASLHCNLLRLRIQQRKARNRTKARPTYAELLLDSSCFLFLKRERKKRACVPPRDPHLVHINTEGVS